MPRPLASRARTALKVAVSTALLGWILHTIAERDGLAELSARMGSLVWPWIAAAVLLQLGAVVLGVHRWRLLLEAQGLTVPTPLLFRSYLVGRFVGAFTPSTTGLDVYRAVDIGRRTGDAVRSAGAIVLEKLVGLVGLSLLTFALLPAGASRFYGAAGLAAAAAMGLTATLGLRFLRAPRVPAFVAARLPAGLRERLDRATALLTTRPLGRGTLASVLGLSLLSHLFTTAVFVATGLALHVAVTPLDLLVVGNAIVIATLVPISVGGVGVREGTAVLLLGLLGVDPTDATLLAVLGYLSAQPPALLGWLASLAEGAPSPAAVPAVDELVVAEVPASGPLT